MNYRHAFHAGNFADVMKHAALARIIVHLEQKEAPFRVIDTHAGVGVYDLAADPARRTGEWVDGIARLLAARRAGRISAAARELLAPYLDVIDALNPNGRLARYPGSPLVARGLLRRDDRLQVNELHPDDGARLARLFARDRQVTVTALDGWIALKAALPPIERRAVVLVDPPFEQPGEFDRIARALAAALRRFATGIYVVWYPIKSEAAVAAFHAHLAATALPRVLIAELRLRAPAQTERLAGSGLVIVNPPYRLDHQLAVLLAEIAAIVATDTTPRTEVRWLTGDPGR